MDRELVLTGLLIITVTATLLGISPWSPPAARRVSARGWERAAWRAVWWPGIPVVLVISVLIGWAVVEPARSDEPLPTSAFVVSAVFLALWIRVALRAVRAQAPEHVSHLVAGTIGLWRPHIIFSQELTAALDEASLRAARAHEAEHVRHRDPLRILLAQVITDLQWPWPAAQRRFERWRRVLELARDEDARAAGVDGADLAAALVVAVRLQCTCGSAAPLIRESDGLEERIGRLLAPIPADNSAAAPHALALVPLSLCGVVSGMHFGEAVVQTLVRWL